MANSPFQENLSDIPVYKPALTPEEQAQAEQAQNAFYAEQAVRDAINASNSASMTDKVFDSAKNIVGGAGTGIVDTASFLAGLVGARDTSRILAEGSRSLGKVIDSLGSQSEKGKAKLYEVAQAEAQAKAQAQYEQDIANGMDPSWAAAKREATLWGDTLANEFKSGNILKDSTSGVGSVLSDIALTGGTGALAKGGLKLAKAGYGIANKAVEAAGAKKYLAGIEKAANAVSEGKFVKEGSLFNDLVTSKPAKYLGSKFKENAGWMTSVGLQEGGNQFRQQLLDTLENTNWDNSPEYHARVAEKIEQYKAQYGSEPSKDTIDQIQETVREDLAFESAKESGIKTGLTAAALANLTKWEMKPFERSGKTASRLIGEALTEPVEEGLTEGAGQFFQNQAVRDYVNNKQDLFEDIGRSSATGFASGLGMTGIRGTPSAVVETAKGVGKVAGFVGDHIGLGNSGSKADATQNQQLASVVKRGMNDQAKSFGSDAPIRNVADSIGSLAEKADNISKMNQQEREEFAREVDASIDAVNSSSTAENINEVSRAQAEQFKKTTLSTLKIFKKATESVPQQGEQTPSMSSDIQEPVGATVSGSTNEEVQASKPESSTESPSVETDSSLYGSTKDVVVRGMDASDSWDNIKGDEVKVGGTERGSHNPEGILTRPGTHPDTWNGQKISEIKDPEGKPAIGKFYSHNGSEYVYSNGYTRRVKFRDSKTQGRDAGVEPWRRVVFLDKMSPEYQLFTGPMRDDMVIGKNSPFRAAHINPKTGAISVIDKGSDKWRPLTVEEFWPRGHVAKQFHGGQLKLPMTDSLPDVNKGGLELELSPEGYLNGFHASSGPAYIEHGTTQQKSQPATPAKQPAQKQQAEVKTSRPAPGEEVVPVRPYEANRGNTAPLSGSDSELKSYAQKHQNETIWAAKQFKDSDGKVHKVHLAASDENHAHLKIDNKVVPITAEELDNLDFDNPETFNGHIDKNVQLEDIPVQTYQVENLKTGKKDQLIVEGNGTLRYNTSENIHRLSPQAYSVLMNPQATPQERVNALIAELDSSAGNFKISAFDVARAQRTLSKEDATEAEIEEANQALKAMNKVVTRDEDGQIQIEDAADSKVAEKVKSAFGDGFGDKLTVLRRPFYLLGGKSPVDLVKAILRNPDIALRANKNAGAGMLIKKLIGNRGISERKWMIRSGDSLGTQILTMLNPVASSSVGMYTHISNRVEASPTLKKILCDASGKIKPEFQQTMMIAAVNQLANIVSRPRALNTTDLQRRDIAPWCNSSFMEDASGAGYLADEAMQGLQNSLKTFMGVAIDNDAPINEVDTVFGEMASIIMESMEDSGWVTTKTLEYNVPSYDDMGQELPYVKDECYFFKASSEFNDLFKSRADILDVLFNPNYKNTIWTTKPPVDENIAHSDINVTDDKKAAIKAANSMPAKLNLPYLAFQDALGGEEAIPLLKGYNSTEENKKFSVKKSWIKIEGQKLTRLVSQRFINEILALNPDKALKDIKVYFDHSAIKNSRSMQKGPATYQGNKLTRQSVIFANGTIDLTKAEGYKAWKLTLAQKLGFKTSDENYKNFEKPVQEFLDYIKEAPEEIKDKFRGFINTDDETIRKAMEKSLTPKKYERNYDDRAEAEEDFNEQEYFEYLDSISEGNVKATDGLLNYYRDLCKHFPDYDLMSEEGQNAVLEAFRYNLATRKERQSFEPHIFLEIDGKNDGPSWANRLFGIVKGQFSPEFVRNNIKTGFFILTDAVNQDNILSFLNGAEDKASGIHEEVSKNKLPQRLKTNINYVKYAKGNKRLGYTPEMTEAYTESTRAILKLFKVVGIVEGDVDAFMDGKGSITFTKGISKNAVTVVNYGAQVAGLVAQTINMIMEGKYGEDGLYARLNNLLQEIPTDDSVPKKEQIAKFKRINGQYQEILQSFKTLFSYEATKEYGGKDEHGNVQYQYVFKKVENPDLKKYLKGAVDVFPDADFRVNTLYMSEEELASIKEKYGDVIQGFQLTDAGEQHLTKLLSPIIGETLYGSVVDAIGSDAMQATKIPQVSGSVLNGMAMLAEATLLHELNKRGNVTQNDLYRVRRKIKKIMPAFTFQSGAKVVAERTSYRTAEKPLYKGRSPATSFYPSRGRLTDIGVAAGALVTQGLGDTSTMDRIQRTLAEEDVNIGAVFDGAYSSPEQQPRVERVANEAVMQASRQKPIEVIYNRLKSACKFLTTDPELSKLLGLKKDVPLETIIGTVIGRLSAQQYLDGTPMTETDKKIYSSRNGNEYQSLQYQFTRSFQQFLYPEIPSTHPFGYNKKRAINLKDNANTIVSKFHDLGVDFVDLLDECAVAEKVKHAVLDDLPQSFHHMAGGETNFVQGAPLKADQFKKLMNKVNKTMPNGRKYTSAEEFISAYLAYRADEYANSHLSEADKNAWKRATNQFRSNNDVSSRVMDSESAKMVEDALGIKEVKPVKVEPYVYHSRKHTVPKGVIRQAFKQLGEKHKANAIYANIFKKIENLIPENTEVNFYPDKKSLPADVQKLFNKSGQNGIFFKQGGVPKIYVISQDARNDWNHEKNLEVFMHEGIHAAVSSIIEVWSHNPADVLPTQKQALDNLYNLLNDFKSLTYIGRYKPQIIKDFQDILNDTQKDEVVDGKTIHKPASLKKAEMVDEAMAYILSNEELFDALSKAKFKMASTETHQNAIEDLLGKLKQAAKKAWAAIMSVVTGSPMDQFLNKDTDPSKIKNGKDLAREFLYFYGVNTLTFLNDVGYIRGKGEESKDSKPKCAGVL